MKADREVVGTLEAAGFNLTPVELADLLNTQTEGGYPMGGW
jgi:hypothetical protein